MHDHSIQDVADFHKTEAARCNNAAWSLVESPQLSQEDILQLLTLAATARHHWHAIGTPSNVAHAELLFAWALAKAGSGALATLMADEALAFFEADGDPWERAFARGAKAAACAANQDPIGHRLYHEKAKESGDTLTGANATYFDAAFSTVPVP